MRGGVFSGRRSVDGHGLPRPSGAETLRRYLDHPVYPEAIGAVAEDLLGHRGHGAFLELEPGVTIMARGHDSEQCRRLRDLGATMAVSENLEASLELARAALTRDSGDVAAADAMLERFRRAYYAEVDRDDKSESVTHDKS